MLTTEQLTTMLAMQDKMNRVVNPEWLTAGYPWHRAIMAEAVELLEHYGWKWWKKQEPNLAQARIELVDIWHFALSKSLEAADGNYADTVTAIEFQIDQSLSFAAYSTANKVDALVQGAVEDRFVWPAFKGLMNDVNLDWQQLYQLYIAKNVLNMFRQANGYKDGSYIKMWDGKEDNVCLDTLMTLKPDATPEQLTVKLGQIYAQVKAAV